MSTTQYKGRKIDIMAWNPKTPTGAFAGDHITGDVVTGILKLAQRWLITFLTKRDSIKYDYRRRGQPVGTQFMHDVSDGVIHTETEMFSAFALAELEARRQMQAEDKSSDPPDERLDKAALTSVRITGDTAELTVKIFSKAGSVDLILPISTIGA